MRLRQETLAVTNRCLGKGMRYVLTVSSTLIVGLTLPSLRQGLLYGLSPELDAVLRASSAGGRGSAAGSGRGSAPRWGASSSAVGMPLDMGGFEDKFVFDSFSPATVMELTFPLVSTQLPAGLWRRV
jgi:hypothetical protein